MQISRLLVVYKKSYYELYGYTDPDHNPERLEPRQRPMLEVMQLSHEENQRTLNAVCHALDALRVPYDCLYRGELAPISTTYDLILSVGGDGTLLEVSRYTRDIPVLGVNSDPSRSTAFFCAANRTTIDTTLKNLFAGQVQQVPLARLQVAHNDTPLPYYALNDLLVAHPNPAAMATYTVRFNGVGEDQKSSGIWISTAAGSTAAIRSAGGRLMPLLSQKFQYLVREPYDKDGRQYQHLNGLIGLGTSFDIMSRMKRGCLFMDGPHLHYSLELGDVLSISLAPVPLRLVGINDKRQKHF